MKASTFIWADLSTYNTATSISFYSAVFGWDISDLNKYYLASLGSSAVAGIFETPDFLKKINMPHFWMSYFQVESTVRAAEIAKHLGAKIELTTDFNNGQIALIRDTQGAGFTIYDGNELQLPERKIHGAIISTELHVSNLQNVIPFYQALFSWIINPVNADTYMVETGENKTPILLREISNMIKGKYEYWVTTILVKSLQQTQSLIIANGGGIIQEEENRVLMCDNTGEAFFYIQA